MALLQPLKPKKDDDSYSLNSVQFVKKKSTFFLARSPVDFSHHQLRLPFKTKPIEIHQIFRGRFHLNTRSWASKLELLKICCWRHTVNINFMISTLGS